MNTHRTYRNSVYVRLLRHKLAAGVIVALLAVALGATALLTVQHARAQGPEEIAFNEPVIVTLTPGQTTTRTFTVLPGDTVDVRLSRLSEFNYTAVLIDPDQNATPLVPAADGNTAYLLESAELSGSYSLVLQASTGPGDLLIQLNSDAVLPTPLPLGETTVTVGATAIRYELVPPVGTGDTTLTLTALTPPNAPYPTLPAYMLVNAASGEVVFTVSEGQLPYMSATLPAQQSYLLALIPGEDPNAVPQQVIIAWSEASTSESTSSSSSGQSSSGQSSSSQSSSGQSSSGQSSQSTGTCQMYFTGAVNVRSGPSTDYQPPIGQAQAGSTYPVTGHDGSYAWYQIDYNGGNGWVSGGIGATELQGDCSGITTASYPPLGQQPSPTYTYTPAPGVTPTYTYTPAPGVTPTYTYTPPPGVTPTYTYTPPPPTYTYTPSYTPTDEAQIAPPDSNYRLVVPLDGTVSISEVISYPNGDVEDVVSYDVSGLNNSVALPGGQANLSFQLVCTGTGTEYVNFRIDGQNYTCGGTFQRTVNADSKTGAIRITLNGGSASYVQWTVIGSAPRTN